MKISASSAPPPPDQTFICLCTIRHSRSHYCLINLTSQHSGYSSTKSRPLLGPAWVESQYRKSFRFFQKFDSPNTYVWKTKQTKNLPPLRASVFLSRSGHVTLSEVITPWQGVIVLCGRNDSNQQLYLGSPDNTYRCFIPPLFRGVITIHFPCHSALRFPLVKSLRFISTTSPFNSLRVLPPTPLCLLFIFL